MARLNPLVADSLFDDPAYRRLPAAGVGMLWRLVEHIHKTDYAPLPTASAERQALARAHPSTWKAHRDQILALIDRWYPKGASYHAQRQLGRWTLQSASAAAHASKARRRIAASGSSPPLSPLLPTAPMTSPPPAWQANPRSPKADRPMLHD